MASAALSHHHPALGWATEGKGSVTARSPASALHAQDESTARNPVSVSPCCLQFHFLAPAPRPAHIPAAAQASPSEGIRAMRSILQLGQTGERKPTSHPHADETSSPYVCPLSARRGGGMTSALLMKAGGRS